MTESLDRRFMMAAIGLGRGALGTTWPNPAVGAILVKDRRVVGRGRTAKGGRPHAEPLALQMAGEAARDATLYVSLEPCSHHGKTPPCTDAIVAAGVGRVVAALVDPNPEVGGNGLRGIDDAGIETVSGLMQETAGGAHAGHLRRVASGRPHVVLKLAVSADDAIGREGEARVAVTGDVARRHVQALRSRFDAILVGRGTVEADDPQLTVRLAGLEDRSPVRVVLDSEGRLGPKRRVFAGAVPTWILGATQMEGRVGTVRALAVPRGAGGVDLEAAMKRLAEQGITRLLVEGGARVARGFIEADLVDEAILFRSPQKLGSGGISALAGLPLATIEHSERFRRIERRRFGADMMSRYERVH